MADNVPVLRNAEGNRVDWLEKGEVVGGVLLFHEFAEESTGEFELGRLFADRGTGLLFEKGRLARSGRDFAFRARHMGLVSCGSACWARWLLLLFPWLILLREIK